jgi:PIN domain nuclease of toxin-antitoxin system
VRFLLDTHILIWVLAEPQKLPAGTRAAIEDQANEVLFSAASIWEIAIKTQLRRFPSAVAPEEIARAANATGFGELPVRSPASAYVAKLAMHHRDPFDRILIAQAICEPARLLTADRQLMRYSDLVTLAE